MPPFLGTGCVKKPRMSTLMNPSNAFGLNSKKCIRRAVRGDPGVASEKNTTASFETEQVYIILT